MRKTIVVESSAKIKTLMRLLRGEYTVVACGGHIADLPKDSLGVDVEQDFGLKIVPNKTRVERLKKKLSDADEIYLATDPDREGEAISRDLLKFCVPEGVQMKRIAFNSLTWHAVTEALEKPRNIDEDLVEAQRARRALDRLIGFILSDITRYDPNGPQCPAVGRVIVPATMLVLLREDEIKNFVEETFHRLEITLAALGREFTLDSVEEWTDLTMAKQEGEKLREAGSMCVTTVDKDPVYLKNPPPPFSTADLQVAAERFLGFSPARTMKVAQSLYEGVKIDGKATALITYMRTDSTRVSPEAMGMARKAITGYPGLGDSYYKGRPWSAVQGAQDAHEAIRPAHADNPNLFPTGLEGKIDEEHFELYRLVFFRFIASQMVPAVYEKTQIEAEGAGVEAEGEFYRMKEKGFLMVYCNIDPEYGIAEKEPPAVMEGDEYKLRIVETADRVTRPPARYSEGSLIRALKERGIGRPSTYSSSIQKIKRYRYVRWLAGKLRETERGRRLCNYLAGQYGQVMDLDYTASMEKGLDKIAKGERTYEDFLQAEWRWLEPAHSLAVQKKWLGADLTTAAQAELLKRLGEELDVEIPEGAFESRIEAGQWIGNLLRIQEERPGEVRLSKVEGPEDVNGSPCYSFHTYHTRPFPEDERAHLRSLGFRRVRDFGNNPPALRFRRQDKKKVEAMREKIIKRYEEDGNPLVTENFMVKVL